MGEARRARVPANSLVVLEGPSKLAGGFGDSEEKRCRKTVNTNVTAPNVTKFCPGVPCSPPVFQVKSCLGPRLFGETQVARDEAANEYKQTQRRNPP